MRIVGILATLVSAAVAAVLTGVAVTSFPDIKRYIRISRM